MPLQFNFIRSDKMHFMVRHKELWSNGSKKSVIYDCQTHISAKQKGKIHISIDSRSIEM